MLDSTDAELLRVMDEIGGFTTGQISHLAKFSYGSNNKRQRSGAVRSWLMRLQGQGLVKLLDGQKPAAWMRTPAGTKALDQFDKR